LNPKKLTGFFFGSEASHHEALRSTMSEFAENAYGLQLVYVASERQVTKFNEFKSTDFTAIPSSSKGFYGVGNQTQMGQALIGNFKVSVLYPILLICNGRDRVLDANGLSTLKSQSDPYAYWKMLDSVSKSTATSKPALKKTVVADPSTKLTIGDQISRSEELKTQVLHGIDDAVSLLVRDLGNGGSSSPQLLSNASKKVNQWLDYSRELQAYTKSIRESLSIRIEEQKRTDDEEDEVFSSLLKATMNQQHAELVKLDEAFSGILMLRAAFRTLFVKCAKYNDNIDVLGQKKISELIERDISNFQQTHLKPLLHKQQNQSTPKRLYKK
jgi:hypothetical protein